MTDIPLGLQIAAVSREIAMRKRVYPKWISLGRMTQNDADQGIAVMEAVRETLYSIAAERDAQVQPPLL